MTAGVNQAGGPAAPRSDTAVVTLVSAAHFISHCYILLLPPLFPIIRADFGISYTQLGVALSAFGVISAILQTPAGFLVDRIGARGVLVMGLALGGAVLIVGALLKPFWTFVLMFALLGVANTTYHPANYALLSHHVSGARMGRAFSFHTFAGMLGGAVTPAMLLAITGWLNWRAAYAFAGVFGLLTAGALLLWGQSLTDPPKPEGGRREDQASWRLLFSRAILLNLLLFLLIALSSGALQNYSVVALQALYGTSLAAANAALSAYLTAMAAGVLAGGVIATRFPHPNVVAISGVTIAAMLTLVVAFVDMSAAALFVVMGLAGLATGSIMPSRDLIVRAATPRGSFGKVFGFVSTGFNLGGIVMPFLYGWMMDNGEPRAILIASAAFSLLCVAALLPGMGRQRVR